MCRACPEQASVCPTWPCCCLSHLLASVTYCCRLNPNNIHYDAELAERYKHMNRCGTGASTANLETGCSPAGFLQASPTAVDRAQCTLATLYVPARLLRPTLSLNLALSPSAPFTCAGGRRT